MLSCSVRYPGSFLQPESHGVATNGEYGTVHPCRFSSFTSTRSVHSVVCGRSLPRGVNHQSRCPEFQLAPDPTFKVPGNKSVRPSIRCH